MQNDLLDLGADLSVPGAVEAEAKAKDGSRREDEIGDGDGDEDGDEDGDGDGKQAADRHQRPRLRVTAQYTEWLEGACDEVNATLAPLRSFVIPGGTAAAAQLHVCRTVCRRAERRAIALGAEGNPEVVRYLNRLSDLLFILARAVNKDGVVGSESGSEPLWDPGAHGSGSASQPT